MELASYESISPDNSVDVFLRNSAGSGEKKIGNPGEPGKLENQVIVSCTRPLWVISEIICSSHLELGKMQIDLSLIKMKI